MKSIIILILILIQILISSTAIKVQNNTILDLSSFSNHFVQVELTHALNQSNKDIELRIIPPSNHGIILRIHEIQLRNGVPLIGIKSCYEYITFKNLRNPDQNGSNPFACGIYNEKIDELVGTRSFVTGVNDSILVTAYFTNEIFSNTEGSHQNPNKSQYSTFTLDITAYTDCKDSPDDTGFNCGEGQCISPLLACDKNSNCPLASNSVQNFQEINSEDELNCEIRKRESETSTTQKPILTFNISWPSWIWRKKEISTTTIKPVYVINYYDTTGIIHDESYEHTNGWAHQFPLLTVILIFTSVTFLLFGICLLLARLNTEGYFVRNVNTPTTTNSSHDEQSGRVYFYPESSHRISLPPTYTETEVEKPPDYNIIFQNQNTQ